MIDDDIARRLYPNTKAIEQRDLYAVHQQYETPIADRPSDVEGLNREFEALGMGSLDARALLSKVAAFNSDDADNRKRLAQHADTDARMVQLDKHWPEERKRVAEWLSRTAPGVYNLVQQSGAGNDVDLLLELRGAYRRSRVRG